MSFELLLEEIASNVKTILDANDSGDVNFQVSPAKPGFGDASCNAPFLLAKRLGKNPREIASDLAKSYSKFAGGLVANASAHPSGYLNFEADWEKLGTLVLQNSIKPEYGSGTQQWKNNPRAHKCKSKQGTAHRTRKKHRGGRYSIAYIEKIRIQSMRVKLCR